MQLSLFGIVLCVFMLVNAIEVHSTPAGRKPALGCGIQMFEKKIVSRQSARIRIAGGQASEKDEWPWMAAVVRPGDDQYCGGSLITDQHIITAANCVENLVPANIKVRLAEYITDGIDKEFEVEEIIMHPDYNSKTYLHDIAVLKLKKTTQFTDSSFPICLPPEGLDLEGKNCYFTGWISNFSDGVMIDVLLKAFMPVWNNTRCRDSYQYRAVDTNFQLCAGLEDSGKGDSGGLLMYQMENEWWTVAGVVSSDFRKCGKAGKPESVYTRFSSYVPWIKMAILPLQSPAPPNKTTEADGCGVHFKTVLKIVSGTELAKKDVYPWMAALFLKKNTGFPDCGAVLITDQHVLTAAHCVHNLEAADIMVRLGEHDVTIQDGDEKDFVVEKIVVHEKYDYGTIKNDIAVLKLKGIITQSMKSISKICLPPNEYDVAEYGCYVAGWGQKEFGGHQSRVLQEVLLKVWIDDVCKKVYENRIDPDFQLCASGNTRNISKDSCKGDSGGPLIYSENNKHWTLVGLVSYGRGCGKIGIPGVYTRVSAYLSWIRNAIS